MMVRVKEMPTRSELERTSALARLKVEDMSAHLRDAGAAGADAVNVEKLFAFMEESLQDLRSTLDAPIGLNVKQTATWLEVSPPTVRKWIEEDLLEQVPGRSPVEVTQVSVVKVERIMRFVRQSFPARKWTEQLAAFMHDRDLQGQDWAREGIEQAERGEYVRL